MLVVDDVDDVADVDDSDDVDDVDDVEVRLWFTPSEPVSLLFNLCVQTVQTVQTVYNQGRLIALIRFGPKWGEQSSTWNAWIQTRIG